MDTIKFPAGGASIRPHEASCLQRIVAAKFEAQEGALRHRLNAQKLKEWTAIIQATQGSTPSVKLTCIAQYIKELNVPTTLPSFRH